jgi:hypothetical protein
VARLQYCRAMLSIHGVLTDAENAKVLHRIKKYKEKSICGAENDPIKETEYDDE